VMMTAVLCVMFFKVFDVPAQDYATYLLAGLTVWQFLHEAAVGGCRSFLDSARYIRQQPAPLAIFPLRTVLGAGFHACIAIGLALVLAAVFNGPNNGLCLISLIPSLVLMFLFGWSLAILSGMFHAHFPDTQHILEIVFQILFYLTPIIYMPDTL